MKKINIILIIFLIFSCCSCGDNTNTETKTEPIPTTEPTIFSQIQNIQNNTTEEPIVSDFSTDIYSTSSLLYCVEDYKIIYGENIDAKIYPASLTKILTACTALKYADENQRMYVRSELELVQRGSSICLIANGHILTLHDLLIGLLVASGNDAAYTIAVNTAKSISGNNFSNEEATDYFVELMNSFAKEIGLKSSNFTNPDGWDDEMQYTTARDLLCLSLYALSVPTIKEVVGYSEKYVVFESGENITWKTSNKLLLPDSEFYCDMAFGIKTGTTSNAGNCLVGVFAKNGKTYITIVTGCTSDDNRYKLTLQMLNSLT